VRKSKKVYSERRFIKSGTEVDLQKVYTSRDNKPGISYSNSEYNQEIVITTDYVETYQEGYDTWIKFCEKQEGK